jgi:hypothetical protein
MRRYFVLALWAFCLALGFFTYAHFIRPHSP